MLPHASLKAWGSTVGAYRRAARTPRVSFRAKTTKRPPVLAESDPVDLDLSGDVVDDLPRHLLRGRGEAPLLLEELEQDSETKPSGAGLVGHQAPVVLDERPRGKEILGFPVLAHGTSSLWWGAGKCRGASEAVASEDRNRRAADGGWSWSAQRGPGRRAPGLPCGWGHVREYQAFKDTTSENASSTKLLGLVGYIEDRPRPDWR
jgi:hypothetical protein